MKKTIDSCIWVSVICKSDTCHEKVIKEADNIFNGEILMFDHVYSEVLTVLRRKHTESHCHSFMELLKCLNIKIKTDVITPEILKCAEIVFLNYKKLSFTDSLLIAISKINNIKLITLDKDLKRTLENIK